MKIIKQNNILLSDLHTHTISGNAFNTTLELAREAKEKGIKVLGITDHGPALELKPPKSYFRYGGKNFPRKIEGIKILFGIEANIINEKGKLDLPDDILKTLDIVIAGLHRDGYTNYNKERDCTDVIKKVINNPLVDIISHPYNSDFTLDMKKIVEESKRADKIMEINTSYIYRDRDNEEELRAMREMIKFIKRYGVKIIINSDSHVFTQLGCDKEMWQKLESFGLREKDIINNDMEELARRFKFKA